MQESDPSSLLHNSLSGIVIKAAKSKKASVILPDDDDPSSSPLNNSMSGIVIKEDPGLAASNAPSEDMYEGDVNQDIYENELHFGEGDRDEGVADGAAEEPVEEPVGNTSDGASAGKNQMYPIPTRWPIYLVSLPTLQSCLFY